MSEPLVPLGGFLDKLKRTKDVIDLQEGKSIEQIKQLKGTIPQQQIAPTKTRQPQKDVYSSGEPPLPSNYNNVVMNSNLPDFIKESLASQPPISSEEGLGLSEEQLNYVNPNRKQQVLQESTPTPIRQQTYQQPQNINRDDTRKIIREELEYMFEKYMKKGSINESTYNESIDMTGEEISIVKGDYIYFANIYDRKKIKVRS